MVGFDFDISWLIVSMHACMRASVILLLCSS